MTNENHDFTEAVEIVTAIMKIVGDPRIKEKLRKLREGVREAMLAQENLTRQENKEPERGTCPTCRKHYTLKKNGALRRHGHGKCYTDNQLPAEVIPAVLAIAQLGDDSTETFNGRAQSNTGN